LPSRPFGVSVLSILEALGGVGTIVIGALALQEVSTVASSFGLSLLRVPDFFTFFSVEIVLGALGVVTAPALWTVRRWGRTMGVYLGVIDLVYTLGFGAYFVSTYSDYTETEAMLIPFIISLAAVFYLERPGMKDFFTAAPERTRPPQQGTAEQRSS
jgi:uncharacterized membrane protein (DUF2068 family)